jgi:Ethanolamine utilization protein EutJ (predicted chaperonin)
MKQTNKVIDWLKVKVEKSLAKDLNLKETKVYLSCDRPTPDVLVECVDENNEKHIYRFLIV